PARMLARNPATAPAFLFFLTPTIRGKRPQTAPRAAPPRRRPIVKKGPCWGSMVAAPPVVRARTLCASERRKELGRVNGDGLPAHRCEQATTEPTVRHLTQSRIPMEAWS